MIRATCAGCAEDFMYSPDFIEERGWAPPKRCPACRQLERYIRAGRQAQVADCSRCGGRFAALLTAIEDRRPLLCFDCRPVHAPRR
jgi:hypothetical protein